MIPLRSNILYQDLGTINQLISQKKFLSMDDEGVAIWWRGILSQIAKRVKQKFYYYDRNRCYNHPDKFNYHTRVLTNSIVEKFIKQKEDPNEYIVDTIRRLVDNSFESREISALEVFLSNINYYSFFLRLPQAV